MEKYDIILGVGISKGGKPCIYPILDFWEKSRLEKEKKIHPFNISKNWNYVKKYILLSKIT
jgi:hypothetical protein